MLRRTMTTSVHLQRGLDDLLADLVQARRQDAVGRLALLAYCEVRCWARQAGELAIAERAAAMFTEQPGTSAQAFLVRMDRLIADLEQLRTHFQHEAAVDSVFWPAEHATALILQPA
jgi:hypothetical protein